MEAPRDLCDKEYRDIDHKTTFIVIFLLNFYSFLVIFVKIQSNTMNYVVIILNLRCFAVLVPLTFLARIWLHQQNLYQ